VRELNGTNFKGRDLGKATAACELFVRADLSRRGFDVTVPVSPTAKHDLHAKFPSIGWQGIQVKAAQLSSSSNKLRQRRGRCESPILAMVYLPQWRVEYRAGTEKLPIELITDLEAQIRGFESWQHDRKN
jgi:hypothetical protein